MHELRLYQLDNIDGNCTSPFVWRIKLAARYKALTHRCIPISYLDIPNVGLGDLRTVPIVEHRGLFLDESWRIAEWLDTAFPDTPRLFGSTSERSLAEFFDKWFGTAVMPPLFRSCVFELFQRTKPHEQPYFKSTRERMLGESLESISRRSHDYLSIARRALLPMRLALRRSPYLGGTQPNYADFIGWGALAAFTSVAPEPLLASNDTLNEWVGRGRALLDF